MTNDKNATKIPQRKIPHKKIAQNIGSFMAGRLGKR
jgi:hypothetical protein